jgi:hypothetical protein
MDGRQQQTWQWVVRTSPLVTSSPRLSTLLVSKGTVVSGRHRHIPLRVTKREVCDRSMGREPLPWEQASPGSADLVRRMGHLRRSVLSCFESEMVERPTEREVPG